MRNRVGGGTFSVRVSAFVRGKTLCQRIIRRFTRNLRAPAASPLREALPTHLPLAAQPVRVWLRAAENTGAPPKELPVFPVLPPAILALADGTVFVGHSIGATGSTVGEVVFNTALTGYQEILTDPSYCRQIVTLTYPHIGNYGVNGEDIEASKVHAAGLIIKDLPIRASNFRQTQTLSQYLQAEGTVGIANIDTRKLTRLLRAKGAQNGAIIALPVGQAITDAVIADAVAKAQAAPSMNSIRTTI